MQTLRQQLDAAVATGQPVVIPGVYDALSARLAADAGFTSLYVTGAGLANSRLGVPDIGLVSLSQLVEHVSLLAEIVDIPLVVDSDTGFGNAVAVVRTVRLLERAGASAIQIEDQVSPKKCGHFAGKEVIPVAEMVGKIHAALDHRRSSDTLIIARTDAAATDGLDEAIERGRTFQEAGADAVFVEAPTSLEDLAAVTDRIPGPLVVNMVEGGLTPLLSREALGGLGFHVVVYANAALRMAQRAVANLYEVLAAEGSTLGLVDRMASWEQRQNAVGKPFFDELEQHYS